MHMSPLSKSSKFGSRPTFDYLAKDASVSARKEVRPISQVFFNPWNRVINDTSSYLADEAMFDNGKTS